MRASNRLLVCPGGATDAAAGVLGRLFPPFVSPFFRAAGGARWACEISAWATPLFFHFLVGPTTVKAGPVVVAAAAPTAAALKAQIAGAPLPPPPPPPPPEVWQSTLVIEECRFLKASGGCRALCAFVCKGGTERFFNDTLLMPVRLDPNYDDYSCEMCFGAAGSAPGMLAADAGSGTVDPCATCGAVLACDSDLAAHAEAVEAEIGRLEAG